MCPKKKSKPQEKYLFYTFGFDYFNFIFFVCGKLKRYHLKKMVKYSIFNPLLMAIFLKNYLSIGSALKKIKTSEKKICSTILVSISFF